jgi:hypothetical protein
LKIKNDIEDAKWMLTLSDCPQRVRRAAELFLAGVDPILSTAAIPDISIAIDQAIAQMKERVPLLTTILQSAFDSQMVKVDVCLRIINRYRSTTPPGNPEVQMGIDEF